VIWKAVQAAKALGVIQPKVAELMRGKINVFALDTLFNLETAAGRQLVFRISEAA
jgi:predicted XRE-type DNA-binding protein